MCDPHTFERGALIQSLGALLARMRIKLDQPETHTALLKCAGDLEIAQRDHAMTVTRAAMSSRFHGSADGASIAFQLQAHSDDLEESLLRVIDDMRTALSPFADTMKSRRDPLAYVLRDFVKSMDRIQGSVERSLRGESRGARESMAGPREMEICEDCGADLALNSARSERYCPRCARVYPIFGVVFDEQQLFSQEGQRTKSGCFSPSTHHDEWMNNILALEPESLLVNIKICPDSPAEIVEKLRVEALRQNKIISMLDVESLRKLLKAIGRTDLNPHISLLMKKVTGTGPPEIPKGIRMRARAMFTRVLEARSQLVNNSANRRYYPYYTIKIFDLILAPGDPGRKMFKFIHMQSEDTLTKNDKEWKRICNILGWEYRATIKSRLLK